MKVLFVPPISYPLHMGGFESQVLHIYNSLRELGITVEWYNLSNTDISQYDIVHFHSSAPELVSIAMKAKDLQKKIVITPMVGSPRYSNSVYQIKLFTSRLPGLFYVMKACRQMYSTADSFITLTSFEKNRLQRVFKVNKEVSVIPNGIDDSFFRADNVHISIPFDNYMLVVGRIEPNKNQLPLIKISNELKLNLIIVGEPGTGQKDYFDLCKNSAGDNVLFWGKESNPNIMRALYNKAALTAIPSITEMLPLVIFESLSQKTPVLCTTHCGLYPEVIEGLFYSKPTYSSFLKNIIRIWPYLTSLQIGSEGIYSWKYIASQHVSIYNRLLI